MTKIDVQTNPQHVV